MARYRQTGSEIRAMMFGYRRDAAGSLVTEATRPGGTRASGLGLGNRRDPEAIRRPHQTNRRIGAPCLECPHSATHIKTVSTGIFFRVAGKSFRSR